MTVFTLPTHRAERVIFGGALYDLLATIPFATPWSANAVLQQMSVLHQQLGLGGEALPAAHGVSMLFINLMGSLVVLWSLVRLLQPSAFNGAVDSVGRLLFAGWMSYALLGGATPLIGAFMAGELIWFCLQASAVRTLWQQNGRLLPAA